MQSQDSVTRIAGAVKHPAAAEWMAYLYDEVTPERKHDLTAHLAQCAACGEQVNEWRAGLGALDDWKLPKLRRPTSAWQPGTMFKWAAAAAVVLAVGFAVGRGSATNAQDIAELKTAVTQLSEKVATAKNSTISPAARAELVQLLADFSKLTEEQRTEDRRVVGLALREMDLRLGKLRRELETVALNTENGFQQTKEGLTTLASYAVADHASAGNLNNPETKN